MTGLKFHPICKTKGLAAKDHGSQGKMWGFTSCISRLRYPRLDARYLIVHSITNSVKFIFASVLVASASRPTRGMQNSPGGCCARTGFESQLGNTEQSLSRRKIFSLPYWTVYNPAVWQWEMWPLSPSVLGYTKVLGKAIQKEGCQRFCSQDLQTHERPWNTTSQQWQEDNAKANITFIWRFSLWTHQADL